MTQHTITAVIFDWDMTLAYSLDIDSQPIERMGVLFRQHGVDATQAEVETAASALNQEIARGDTKGVLYPQKRQQIIHMYRQLLSRLGHADTSAAFAAKIYNGYARLPHTLFADVRPTMTALTGQNKVIGVLSNHSRTVRPLIEAALADFVNPRHITISEEVGVHKPGKTIFRRAAQRLGVPADRCVYIGDNLQVDAIGAVTAGNYALGVWLNRRQIKPERPLPNRVRCITTLHQLPPLLNDCL